MISLIKLLPVVIGMIIGGGGVAGLMKYTAPKIEPCPACECNCPPQANTIDFDKIKNAKNISIHQHYEVQMDGDSLFLSKMEALIKSELERVKLARCK